MGLRYRIPFKDSDNKAYEVLVYRDGYTGEVKELTGAPSCFVVSGTDEDFMYVPVRTSTATISVLDSDLLLDLYSINNQYARVQLYREGVLEWTGYIKPEQFTQPYVPTVDVVSVECVGALSTLEHMEYKELVPGVGVVSLWTLLKHLVTSAKGGYNAVYMPWVYGATQGMTGNVLERITLIENNFLKEEMNLMEVMEAVCKFLNWTVYDVRGCLWFVDHDWGGTYRKYDEALSTYTEVRGSDVLVQDIGFNGSGANTLDVVPGYNKASVKALNHVFDDVVKDEPYDVLEAYDNGTYVIDTYKGSDGAHGVRKLFLKPMFWKMYAYDSYGNVIDKAQLSGYSASVLNYTLGSLLMKEADYQCVAEGDSTPAEGVTDFNSVDSVQMRVAQDDTADAVSVPLLAPMLTMKGENAVYADCAISIDGTVEAYFDRDMAGPVEKRNAGSNYLQASISCGGKWWNGSAWVNGYASVLIELDDMGKIVSTRTPFTPYKDISGYLIPMDFFVGEPEITLFATRFMDVDGVRFSTGMKIRNLKFGYAKREGVVDEGENGDRVYENVVNEDYMSEADEIEFDISSYNADGASYSKALIDGGWLTNNLYCAVVNEKVRPEELMIRRIVNRYGATKIKLTEAIRMTDAVTPISSLSDRTMVGKRFRMTSGEWDYEQNRMTLQIQEDA